MPIYEYQCRQCGRRTETLQKISDPPLETCEECGGDLKRLVSSPAFQFKGSGWYVTDYARKGGGDGKKPAGEGGGGEKAAGDGGGSAEKASGGEASKPSSGSAGD